MGDLTKNFSRSEFACPCCGQNKIEPTLVGLLQMVRDESEVPMSVNSGYRCGKHNQNIGGVAGSAHTYGKAADIACVDSHSRYLLLKSAFKYFKRIELKETWLHFDIDDRLPQEVAFFK